LGSLVVFSQADDLGTLLGVEVEASWPTLSLQRVWSEPGEWVIVMLGKEQPEAELATRTAEQWPVSARTYLHLGTDSQVAVFAQQG
jgi:hypothetical protein